MQRILCSDWLPERARWSDTARPGLPVSFPQIKFCPSSSECTKVFFSPKLLSAKVKRCFLISLSLSNQENRQREWNKESKNVDKFCNKNRQMQKFVLNLKIWIWDVTNQMTVCSAFIQSGYRGKHHRFSIYLVSFSVLEKKQVRRSFFSVLFMPYYKSFIDQASSVKMGGYWPRSLFAFYVYAKKRTRPISSHLDLALGQ